MKEVIALERGIWNDIRRAKDAKFYVEDDATSTWFVPTAGLNIPEAKNENESQEKTYGEMGEKPVSLQQALSRRGRKKVEEPPAPQRNLNVLGGE